MSTSSLATVRMEVMLRDIRDMFVCCSCYSAPMLPPVHTCRLGHLICATCRNLGRKCSACVVCMEPLSSRNLPLEDILLTLLQYVPKSLTMKESTYLATEAGRVAVEDLDYILEQDCNAQSLASGRTIQCPFPCHMRITATGLYRHFGFQHPEVYAGTLCKNRPYTVFIPYDQLNNLDEQSPTRCLYFLVVGIGDQELKDYDKLADIHSVKASELLSMSHNMRYMLKQRKYLALLSVSRLKDPDVYAFWVTSIYDLSPVTYTLRYNSGFNTVSYQGPPESLHAPAPMNTQGGCLMITSALVKKDFELDPGFLELTLVFHLGLPFPKVLPSEVEHSANPVTIIEL